MDRFNKEELVQRTFAVNKALFEKFKIKSSNEGYSASEAINHLIASYVSGAFDKKVK